MNVLPYLKKLHSRHWKFSGKKKISGIW